MPLYTCIVDFSIGWSPECLFHWKQFVLLAVPGALMILFDWGTGEMGVFLMGMLLYTSISDLFT